MKKLLILVLTLALSCFAGKLNVNYTTGYDEIDFNILSSIEVVTPTGTGQLNINTTSQAAHISLSELSKMEVMTIPANMVFVNGGTFQMGVEGVFTPVHQVTLSPFYIGKSEITQAEWLSVMGSNPSNYTGDINILPVDNITWYDALVYCNKRSTAEGLTPVYTIKGSTTTSDWGNVPVGVNDADWDAVICNWDANGYRLPTEAEWEFAARGGNKSLGYTYAGSNNLDDVAWHSLNSENKTHPIKTKTANELGICDMSGNVWEFVWDKRDGTVNYTSADPQTNPHGQETGDWRSFRGGSWANTYVDCKVSDRSRVKSWEKYTANGLRVCRNL